MFTKLIRLGSDAELRETENGTFVSLQAAYDYRSKGEDRTQWIDLVLTGSRAEKVHPYLKKGTQIVAYIDDMHVGNVFERANGEKAAALRGRIVEFEFAGAKKENAAAAA